MTKYPDISDFVKVWLDDEEITAIADRLGVTSYKQRYNVMKGKCKNHRLRNEWIKQAKENQQTQSV